MNLISILKIAVALTIFFSPISPLQAQSKKYSTIKKANLSKAKAEKVVTSSQKLQKKKALVETHLSIINNDDENHKDFNSNTAYLFDHTNNKIIYGKNSLVVAPIASVTKLMTAMVLFDANLDLSEPITISEADFDTIKNSHSKLFSGFRIRRGDAILLMLMSSDNRAANALARHYPTGKEGFVRDMNAKAKQLGMTSTNFEDPAGLSAGNISNARDLAIMVTTANNYPKIREFSTTQNAEVRFLDKTLNFVNTNPKVRSGDNKLMQIVLSKTGYIRESGYCLVMTALINSRPFTIVLMDASSRSARLHDITNINNWIKPS